MLKIPSRNLAHFSLLTCRIVIYRFQMDQKEFVHSTNMEPPASSAAAHSKGLQMNTKEVSETEQMKCYRIWPHHEIWQVMLHIHFVQSQSWAFLDDGGAPYYDLSSERNQICPHFFQVISPHTLLFANLSAQGEMHHKSATCHKRRTVNWMSLYLSPNAQI